MDLLDLTLSSDDEGPPIASTSRSNPRSNPTSINSQRPLSTQDANGRRNGASQVASGSSTSASGRFGSNGTQFSAQAGSSSPGKGKGKQQTIEISSDSDEGDAAAQARRAIRRKRLPNGPRKSTSSTMSTAQRQPVKEIFLSSDTSDSDSPMRPPPPRRPQPNPARSSTANQPSTSKSLLEQARALTQRSSDGDPSSNSPTRSSATIKAGPSQASPPAATQAAQVSSPQQRAPGDGASESTPRAKPKSVSTAPAQSQQASTSSSSSIQDLDTTPKPASKTGAQPLAKSPSKGKGKEKALDQDAVLLQDDNDDDGQDLSFNRTEPSQQQASSSVASTSKSQPQASGSSSKASLPPKPPPPAPPSAPSRNLATNSPTSLTSANATPASQSLPAEPSATSSSSSKHPALPSASSSFTLSSAPLPSKAASSPTSASKDPLASPSKSSISHPLPLTTPSSQKPPSTQKRPPPPPLDEFEVMYLSSSSERGDSPPRNVEAGNDDDSDSDIEIVSSTAPTRPLPAAQNNANVQELARVRQLEALEARKEELLKLRRNLLRKQEQEKIEKERIEKERIEKEKIEQEKIQREKAEKEKAEQEKAEKERAEKEKAEKERAERERVEKEKAKVEAEKQEQERIEAEERENERIEAEKREKEIEETRKREREAAEKAQRLEEERVERERLKKEKEEAARIVKERLEKIERDRIEAEKREVERLERERLEQERLEAERLEQERLSRERVEKEQQKERLKAKKIEEERAKQERLDQRAELTAQRNKERRLERERYERELEEEQKRADAEKSAREQVQREKARLVAKEKKQKAEEERERQKQEEIRQEEEARRHFEENELPGLEAETEAIRQSLPENARDGWEQCFEAAAWAGAPSTVQEYRDCIDYANLALAELQAECDQYRVENSDEEEFSDGGGAIEVDAQERQRKETEIETENDVEMETLPEITAETTSQSPTIAPSVTSQSPSLPSVDHQSKSRSKGFAETDEEEDEPSTTKTITAGQIRGFAEEENDSEEEGLEEAQVSNLLVPKPRSAPEVVEDSEEEARRSSTKSSGPDQQAEEASILRDQTPPTAQQQQLSISPARTTVSIVLPQRVEPPTGHGVNGSPDLCAKETTSTPDAPRRLTEKKLRKKDAGCRKSTMGYKKPSKNQRRAVKSTNAGYIVRRPSLASSSSRSTLSPSPDPLSMPIDNLGVESWRKREAPNEVVEDSERRKRLRRSPSDVNSLSSGGGSGTSTPDSTKKQSTTKLTIEGGDDGATSHTIEAPLLVGNKVTTAEQAHSAEVREENFKLQQQLSPSHRRQIAGPSYSMNDEFPQTIQRSVKIREQQWKKSHPNGEPPLRDQYKTLYEQMIFDANRKEFPLGEQPSIRVIPMANAKPTDYSSPEFGICYTNRVIYADGIVPDQAPGCGCKGDCGNPENRAGCACRKRQILASKTRKGGYTRSGIQDFAYDANGILNAELFAEGDPIIECNSQCGCDQDCINRVVGRKKAISIDIFRTEDKGWGIRNPLSYNDPLVGSHVQRTIRKGEPLGVYAGELLYTNEADLRDTLIYKKTGRCYTYVLDHWSAGEDYKLLAPKADADKMVVSATDASHITVPQTARKTGGSKTRNKSSSKRRSKSKTKGQPRSESVKEESPEEDDSTFPGLFSVDAFSYGNWTRFANHNCQGFNVVPRSVYIDEENVTRPLWVYVACKDIKPGEEITISYFGEREPSLAEAGLNLRQWKKAADDLRAEQPPNFSCYCKKDLCRGVMFNLGADEVCFYNKLA